MAGKELRRKLAKMVSSKKGSLLPFGYIQLDYIESNGSQYIDTGLKPKSSYTYEITYKRTATNNVSGIFGAREGSAYNNGRVFGYSYYSGSIGVAYYVAGNASGVFTQLPNSLDTNKHTYISEPIMNKQYVDGVEYSIGGNTTESEWECNYPIFLFCWNTQGNAPTNTMKMRVYNYVVKDSGKEIQHLIPCINPLGSIGMYDTIGKTFFRSPNYALFIEGNVIIQDIASMPFDAQLEYLRSDSAALINTGIIGNNNNLRIYSKVKYNTYVQYGCIFSNYVSEQHNVTRILLSNQNGGYSNFNNITTSPVATNFTINEIHEVYLYNDYTIIDKQYTLNHTQQGTANNTVIALFARDVSASIIRDIGAEIHSFRVYDNNELVQFLIPVRIGTTGYMYDTVSGELFGNIGTGDFILGPDIN